jgi:N-acetylglutamate synthase-like GNAT family acetyltransferase
MYLVKEACSPAELEAILQLRYKILRAPWQQPISTAGDDLELVSINAYISNGNHKVIACGRLQFNSEKLGQVRYMAVDSEYRHLGLGKLILQYLELKGREKGCDKIVLQARENALDFYNKQSYLVVEKSFLLWGEIQHYLMEKSLMPD